jgi:myo-inositol-1(or 4)-monophosphatase
LDALEKKLPAEERDLIKEAVRIAATAGSRLLKSFRKEDPIERGTVKKVKLVYDIVADKVIRKELERRFPGHSYITEETGYADKGSPWIWIIDPLDGTSNYADQNPLFAVSIALWFNGEPVLGVIEAPMMMERFVSVRGYGAYHYDLLRKKVRKAGLSGVTRAGNAYGVYCEGGIKNKKKSLSLLGKYYMQIKDVRKLGSAALELAFVGTGRSESYMTTGISLWDIAAGILFVREAGGALLHFDGTPYEWGEFKREKRFDLLVTNGSIKIKLVLYASNERGKVKFPNIYSFFRHFKISPFKIRNP